METQTDLIVITERPETSGEETLRSGYIQSLTVEQEDGLFPEDLHQRVV